MSKHGEICVGGTHYDGALVEERTIRSLYQYADLVNELRADPSAALALGQLKGTSREKGVWQDEPSRWLTLAIEQLDGFEAAPRSKPAKHLGESCELDEFVKKLMKRAQLPDWLQNASFVLHVAPAGGFLPGAYLFLTYRLAKPLFVTELGGHRSIVGFLNAAARKAGFDQLFSEDLYELGRPIVLCDPECGCTVTQRSDTRPAISPPLHRGAFVVSRGWDADELLVPPAPQILIFTRPLKIVIARGKAALVPPKRKKSAARSATQI